jgi:periplasmic protein TonB
MTSQEEKKNQRIAMLTSIGIHGALLIMFLFMVAWRPPNPPLPEIGIEVNFGTDDQGSGDVQPEEEVGSQGTQPEEPNQPEPQQEVAETPQPTPEKPVEQEVVTAKDESPVTVKEEKKEEPKPEKIVEKVEPKKEEPVKPKPDPNATFNKQSTQNTESTNTSTEGKSGTAESHGDDKNKTGDKGNPEGKLDAKSQYGNPGGGGGGPSLELAGWQWDRKPAPSVPKSESGRVVFEIKVDDAGEIVSVKTLERSVSLEAEKACREEIQRLTFTKTGTNVPEFSTGRITFVITSK